MSKLSFSKELVDATVRYLAARPYNEVANLLERMDQEAAPQLQAQAAKAAPQLQAQAAKAAPSSDEASNESDEAAQTA